MAQTVKKRTTRNYTPEQRQEAIKLAQQMGPSKASQELGIPSGTLTCWVYKSRKDQERQVSAVEPPAKLETISASPNVKVAKRYTPSQRAEILEYSAKHGPAAARPRCCFAR
jgi:transposase-like protein